MTQCLSSIHMSKAKSLICGFRQVLEDFFSANPNYELIGTDRGMYYLDHADGECTPTLFAYEVRELET